MKLKHFRNKVFQFLWVLRTKIENNEDGEDEEEFEEFKATMVKRMNRRKVLDFTKKIN